MIYKSGPPLSAQPGNNYRYNLRGEISPETYYALKPLVQNTYT